MVTLACAMRPKASVVADGLLELHPMQNFDRHVTSEAFVSRAIYDAHAAGTNLFLNASGFGFRDSYPIWDSTTAATLVRVFLIDKFLSPYGKKQYGGVIFFQRPSPYAVQNPPFSSVPSALRFGISDICFSCTEQG